jgi:hypothetical protein
MDIVFADIVKHLEAYFVDDIRDENGHQSGRKEDVGQQANQDNGKKTGNEDEEILGQKRQEYLEKQKHARKIGKEKR